MKRLLQIRGWEPIFSGPVYNEFAVRCPDPEAANGKLQREGIVGGYELAKDYPEWENGLLFCATEMLSKEDMDRVAEILS